MSLPTDHPPAPSESSIPQVTPPAGARATKAWDELGLSAESLALLKKEGFGSPTPVQGEAIPYALAGSDVVASAQTGTGKTAAFVLPMVERFFGREGTFGLILAPTREIAQQIQKTIELFGTPRGIRSIVLIGGIDMRHDTAAIATYPQIIVATPGRLCDHLDRGNIWLDFIEMVVLDEADRMLDMGFSDQLSRIMEDVPTQRQTLLFSATIPPAVERLALRILHEPKGVTIGKPLGSAKSVEQRLVWMREESKNRELRRLLREEKGSIMVFTRSKDGATRVFRALHSAGFYDVTYIHSDRRQSDRESALAEFKSGKYRILIATDVAGRGIHVDAVAHVINYDLPMEAEDYIHRIGRTGRLDATGRATSFVTSRDRALVRRIEKLVGSPIHADFADPFEQHMLDDKGGEGESHGRGGSSRGGRGGGGGRSHSSGGGGRSHASPAPSSHGPVKALATPKTEGHAPAAPKAAGHGPKPEGDGTGDPAKRRRRRGGRGRRGKGGSGGADGPGRAPAAT